MINAFDTDRLAAIPSAIENQWLVAFARFAVADS